MYLANQTGYSIIYVEATLDSALGFPPHFPSISVIFPRPVTIFSKVEKLVTSKAVVLPVTPCNMFYFYSNVFYGRIVYGGSDCNLFVTFSQ